MTKPIQDDTEQPIRLFLSDELMEFYGGINTSVGMRLHFQVYRCNMNFDKVVGSIGGLRSKSVQIQPLKV